MGMGCSQVQRAGQYASTQQKQVQEQKQGQVQEQKQEQKLNAATELVLTASPSALQEFMQDLEQRGEIVQDLLPEDEEMLLGEEAVEMDAEWDFADEDAIPVEEADSRAEREYESSLFSGDVYELRVCSRNGKVSCEVPETGWEGCRGVSPVGRTALSKLTQRAKVYHAIANWLETEKLLTEKAAEFEVKEKTTQKAFCKKHDFKEPTFSKVLKDAVLAWPEATIPLRSLFSYEGLSRP